MCSTAIAGSPARQTGGFQSGPGASDRSSATDALGLTASRSRRWEGLKVRGPGSTQSRIWKGRRRARAARHRLGIKRSSPFRDRLMRLLELLPVAVVQVLQSEHPPQAVAHPLGDRLLEVAAFGTVGGHGSWSTFPSDWPVFVPLTPV